MRSDRTLGTKRYANHNDRGPWPTQEKTMNARRKLVYLLATIDTVLVGYVLHQLANTF